MSLMGKTIQVAKDRAFDDSSSVVPAEYARGLYVKNAPGALALKLMHLMISAASGRMGDPVKHKIRLADIRAVKGMKNHDRKSLTHYLRNCAAQSCPTTTRKR